MTNLRTSNGTGVIRVLHVDDDLSILEVSKEILMTMGNFEINCVCLVDEAFKKLSTEKYDVIISDYEMPQKDGLQFLKELREKHNRLPFFYFYRKRQRRSSHNRFKPWSRWIRQ